MAPGTCKGLALCVCRLAGEALVYRPRKVVRVMLMVPAAELANWELGDDRERGAKMCTTS